VNPWSAVYLLILLFIGCGVYVDLFSELASFAYFDFSWMSRFRTFFSLVFTGLKWSGTAGAFVFFTFYQSESSVQIHIQNYKCVNMFNRNIKI